MQSQEEVGGWFFMLHVIMLHVMNKNDGMNKHEHSLSEGLCHEELVLVGGGGRTSDTFSCKQSGKYELFCY